MSLDIADARKRLIAMGVVNTAAVLAALAALVGYFAFAQGWALYAFAAALLVGFAAQIWFIVALRRAEKGA